MVKLDIKLEGDAAEFAHALPKERRSKKLLYFNSEASLFKNEEKSEDEMNIESEGGMMIKMMEPDNKLYTDLKNRQQIEQREFMTRIFLIERKTGKTKWKLTGKQKKILDYACQEAITEKDSMIIKAWFTPAIPYSVGLGKYGDLPGLILELDRFSNI